MRMKSKPLITIRYFCNRPCVKISFEPGGGKEQPNVVIRQDSERGKIRPSGVYVDIAGDDTAAHDITISPGGLEDQ
jgi:hypothetical protein